MHERLERLVARWPWLRWLKPIWVVLEAYDTVAGLYERNIPSPARRILGLLVTWGAVVVAGSLLSVAGWIGQFSNFEIVTASFIAAVSIWALAVALNPGLLIPGSDPPGEDIEVESQGVLWVWRGSRDYLGIPSLRAYCPAHREPLQYKDNASHEIRRWLYDEDTIADPEKFSNAGGSLFCSFGHEGHIFSFPGHVYYQYGQAHLIAQTKVEGEAFRRKGGSGTDADDDK